MNNNKTNKVKGKKCISLKSVAYIQFNCLFDTATHFIFIPIHKLLCKHLCHIVESYGKFDIFFALFF